MESCTLYLHVPFLQEKFWNLFLKISNLWNQIALPISQMIKETYTVREVYLEPSRTSTMELFAKIVNG